MISASDARLVLLPVRIMPDSYIPMVMLPNVHSATQVEEGLNPACVSVCPTHCMYFGDVKDPNSEVSKAPGAVGSIILFFPRQEPIHRLLFSIGKEIVMFEFIQHDIIP